LLGQTAAVGVACGYYRGNKVCIYNFGGKILGRPERKWGDNSKMVVREIGSWCGMWMDFAHGTLKGRTLVLTMLKFLFSLREFGVDRGCPFDP
jgi:hypothetical protein